MPHDGDGQEPRLDSPTNQPEQSPVETQPTQPVDTGAATDQPTTPTSSTPSEGESPRDDRPRDEQGRFAPKDDSKPAAPDPVKDAIERLSKRSEPDAPKPAGKQAADAKPQAASKATEVKPTDEALKTRTTDDLDAPPEERARWKRDTAERFDRVLSAARTARKELEEAAPVLERGKAYSKVLDEFELHQDIGFVPPEHFAGVVKAQAAINRALIAIHQGRQPAPADVETFTALADNVQALRSRLGLPTPTPAPTPAAIKPHDGPLPQDLQDMVDLYGFDEKRARLLASLEAGSKESPQPAKQATEQPPAPAVAPAPQAKPVGVDMDQLYGRKLLAEMHADGVPNPQENLRVLLKHPQTRQEVIKRFPGTPITEVPMIFDSLDASTRYDILKAAHKALTAAKVPARPNPPPPATPNRGVPSTAAPRRTASANDDPVADAINRLSRD